VLEVFGNGRIGMMVRKGAVALAEQTAAGDAEPLEKLWRDERAGAVAAIIDDANPAAQTADPLRHVVDVPFDDRFLTYTARSCSRSRARSEGVEVLNLLAVYGRRAERELEAVVLRRIVRSRDLNAADDVEVVQRPVVQRRRHDTDVDHIDPGCCQPADQRVAQRGSARPVVAAHRDGASNVPLAEVRRIRLADSARRVRRQILADDPANAVLPTDLLRKSQRT